jgi:uncharacterized membrane protein YdjX (TVP38/TMEM64 family)
MKNRLGWAAVLAVLLALILIPFFLWEDAFTQKAAELAKADAAPALMALAFAGLLAADVALPVPSSLVSVLAARLLGFFPGCLTIWLGMTAGCLAGYWLGAKGGAKAAEKFVGAPELERARGLALRFGAPFLAVSRAVPVLAEASVILAGMTGMPLRRFMAVTSLSNLGIALIYSMLGTLQLQEGSLLLAIGGAVMFPALAILGARRLAAPN